MAHCLEPRVYAMGMTELQMELPDAASPLPP